MTSYQYKAAGSLDRLAEQKQQSWLQKMGEGLLVAGLQLCDHGDVDVKQNVNVQSRG